MLEFGQQVIFTGDNPMFDTADDQPMRRYIDAALAGRADEATRLFEALEPVRDLHRRWVQDRWRSSQLIPISVIKYWTFQLGMTGGPTPSPLPSLTVDEMKELHAEMVFVGLVSD